MGHWNYRVVRKDGYYGIHSVYYDEQEKIIGLSENPEPARSEDLDYLKTQLTLMLEALDKDFIEDEEDSNLED